MNFEIYDHPKMKIIIVAFYETLNELLLYAWSHSAEFHTINSFFKAGNLPMVQLLNVHFQS